MIKLFTLNFLKLKFFRLSLEWLSSKITLRLTLCFFQEPFFLSAHEFSECPHRLSRFVFKELFSFRSVQRTMCILGFLFFSSTLFLNFFQKNLFLYKIWLAPRYLYIYMEFFIISVFFLEFISASLRFYFIFRTFTFSWSLIYSFYNHFAEPRNQTGSAPEMKTRLI